MPAEAIEVPDAPDGLQYVEVRRKMRTNHIGDRIWVDEEAAEESDDFRVIPDDERETIYEQAQLEGAESDAEPEYIVVFHQSWGQYWPGDRAGFAKSEVERFGLLEDDIAALEEVNRPEGAQEAQQTADKMVDDRIEQIDEACDYYEKRSLAGDVADLVDGEPDDREESTLTEFLARHWDTYQRVAPTEE